MGRPWRLHARRRRPVRHRRRDLERAEPAPAWDTRRTGRRHGRARPRQRLSDADPADRARGPRFIGRDGHRSRAAGFIRDPRARRRPGRLLVVRADRPRAAAWRVARRRVGASTRGPERALRGTRPDKPWCPGRHRGLDRAVRARVRRGLLLVGVGRVCRRQGLPGHDQAGNPIRRRHRYDGRDRRRAGRDPISDGRASLPTGSIGCVGTTSSTRSSLASPGSRWAPLGSYPPPRSAGRHPHRPAPAPPRTIRFGWTGWTRRWFRPKPAGGGASA